MSEPRSAPTPGLPGADVDRDIERRLADLPEDAPPADQLAVLEELHDVLAARLGEASG